MDTNFIAIMNWFLHADYRGGSRTFDITWPATESVPVPLRVELLLRAAETDDDEQKFRSTEVTGAWIDESIQLRRVVKQTIISRMGRFPKRADSPSGYVPRYLVETTNPCGAEEEMYWMYRWVGPKIIREPQRGPDGFPIWETGEYDTSTLVSKLPPGPVPPRPPVKGFIGFWQEAGENKENLRPEYWQDIKNMFPEAPEMTQMLVEGKPGYRPEGKPVYRNYKREVHMAGAPLEWKQTIDPYTGQSKGVPLLVGWDNSGDAPATVVLQQVGPLSFQVLKEFFDDRMGIVDFTQWVVSTLAVDFPGYEATHYCDPAGFAEFSKAGGGFTSNAQMQKEVCSLDLKPSIQNLDQRIAAVDSLLARIGGLLIDPRCNRLLNGFFGGYVREENIRMGVNEFKTQPKKNKFSHIHDALQYAVTPLVYPQMKEDRPDIRENLDLEWQEALRGKGFGKTAGSVGWRDSQVQRPVHSGVSRSDRANDGGDPRRWS